jgi:hypothetical protein
MEFHCYKQVFRVLFFMLIGLSGQEYGFCQNILTKQISVEINKQSLEKALRTIGEKGNFHFSYNGLILSKDSLVSIVAEDQPVGVVLGKLLTDKYEYLESKSFVIITPALKKMSLVSPDIIASSERSFTISGIVVDVASGKRLPGTSVLEKQLLAYGQTDEHGYFKIKCKSTTPEKIIIDLTLSKNNYRDTAFHFLESVSVIRALSEDDRDDPGSSSSVENTAIGNLFISAKRKVQNLNLRHFLVNRSFQISLAPGISSRGPLSPQVSNNLSFNVTGGYTGGVNGFEVAGLYNINKDQVNALQFAGVFNLVGGSVNGLQLAGVHNMALGNVNGVQAAGFVNRSEGVVRGLQVSSLLNYAQSLRGIQVGLINVADSSSGLSIGLINIIRKGSYQVSVYSNDLINTGIGFKSGTQKLYSTILVGANLSQGQKLYSFGLGFGRDYKISKKLSLTTQADYQFVNSGFWDDRWFRIKATVNFNLYKNIIVFVGPTWNRYNQSGEAASGYQNVAKRSALPSGNGHYISKWIGWEAGVALSSKFKGIQTEDHFQSKAYSLGVALSAGVGWDEPYGMVGGAEVFLTRKVGKSFSGMLTAGYTHFSIQPRYKNWGAPYLIGYKLKPVRIIPLKAGIRMYVAPRFYVGGEVGLGLNLTHKGDNNYGIYANNKVHFIYSPSIGLNLTKRLDVSFKYEDYSLNSDLKQFAVKTSYQINISKK